jgi:NAD-dependent dihydropyrimidine dehydrogenase PreA subunit
MLVNDISVVDENRCIGCGVCVHHCPEEAINLNRTGPRVAFVPPPRIEQS